MAAALAERSAVPFHLGLTEPVGDTAITCHPEIEGAYDPVEQIWKLPDGTPLTSPEAPKAYTFTASHSIIDHMLVIDDGHADA